ncbi:MAG: L,D-transpeptidase [Chelatococcus sp.]|uniref:L,D-transpeptidase n=1 Tax=unclassified Chelatococcus TaxID=2638111 RepID=UPI001BCC781D|nr:MULTISPECIES: L,D-transpeptidase [unclassified Chelatococcus]CAH1652700.1 Lipoprotein-anchoring transpeptidase ErfK/SrfK [Hyphomicrobiales bacterium]MBS7742997.1 L,D-transpeptidase [Chelatococcus sp. HY11]MBX3538893.1 L,D-transpeptidase [Chelatococcus sp.]MBX3541885.1 L,D-transpeptidase [Chelatococcus sp.]MCO5074224.1 L,D-transpeptidase [Chelatococcus sp.]
MSISRRVVLGSMPLILAACASKDRQLPLSSASEGWSPFQSMYASIDTEPFPVPAIDLEQIAPEFLRREIPYQTREQPGTIVVNPAARYAYLVLENGRALRYGIGVGKQEGFNFRGEAIIARKAEWPGWRPTPEMIKREPDRYGPLRDGLPGGSDSPLGPRALYLYRNGRDTYYRLHGTVEPWTIGTMVSSGCVRLLNQDIMDLYRRVPIGTRVVVLPATSAKA